MRYHKLLDNFRLGQVRLRQVRLICKNHVLVMFKTFSQIQLISCKYHVDAENSEKDTFLAFCLHISYMAHYGYYSVFLFKTPKRHVSKIIISLCDIVVFAGIFTFWYLSTPKSCKNHVFANVENFFPSKAHFLQIPS